MLQSVDLLLYEVTDFDDSLKVFKQFVLCS